MTTKGVSVLDAKLKSMSNADILETWEALKPETDDKSFWDEENDITMGDWIEAVYSEKTRRGL